MRARGSSQFSSSVHAPLHAFFAFLHSRSICHRDLKLENILLETPGPTSRIKVTDFGLSKRWSSTSLLETFVGTPTYMAPEVICLQEPMEEPAPYSSQSDLWSLGLSLLEMALGCYPIPPPGQPRIHNYKSMLQSNLTAAVQPKRRTILS